VSGVPQPPAFAEKGWIKVRHDRVLSMGGIFFHRPTIPLQGLRKKGLCMEIVAANAVK
jgi:hypothetical protein